MMVHIPSGSYFVGSEDPLHPPEEKPLLYARLREYLIDQREISRRQYLACVLGGGCSALASATDPSQEDFPVNFVTWAQARSYCQWVGAELPSEMQWETAARGKSSTVYPTGIRASASVTEGLLPVQQASANEGFLLASMATGLSEWVLDDASLDSAGVLLPRSLTKEQSESRRVENYQFMDSGSASKVVKGGSFKTAFNSFQRASVRRGVSANQVSDWIGFRCALVIP